MDEINKNTPLPTKMVAGNTFVLSGLAKSTQGLSLIATSLTPSICQVDSISNIKMLMTGTCKLSIGSQSSKNITGANPTEFSFEISSPKSSQVILYSAFEPQYELSLNSIVVSSTTSTGLPVHFEASTDDICFVAGDSLIFRKKGYCEFVASQDGNESNLAATPVDFLIEIIDTRRSINCLKGKSVKKVVGNSPVCPIGYKLKK